MRKYFYIVAFMAMGFGMTSCNSNASRLEDLEDIVEEIVEDGAELTEEKLEEISKEFAEKVEELEAKEGLTPEEIKELAKIQGKYAAAIMKVSSKAVIDELEKAGSAIEGFFDGLDED